MIARLYDFRGGYSVDTPPEQMEENEVLTGTNLYYKSKLKKRISWENYCTDTTLGNGAGAGNLVRGIAVAKMNGTYRTVVAVDDTSDVQFYYVTNGTTITKIQDATPANYTFTTGIDVEMREFNNMVIAVNGTDKPAIIRYDGSAIVAQNLEAYDSRSRGDSDWFAGQWDDDASPQFIDDTTDAQDVGVNDFAIATTTNNDGFYVAGVVPFTKIVLTGATDLGTTVVAEYAYYAGSGTWTTVTPTTAPTWTAAEANRTVEWDIPLNTNDGTLLWKVYGDVDTQVDPTGVTGGAKNRYIFRIRFTTADTAGTCDKITVSHEQYLTQIFENDVPDVVAVHKDRVFLGVGNVFRFSPPNSAKNWDSRDIEYLDEGGDNIISMCSGGNFLAIIKEYGWYRYYGTSTESWLLRYGGSEGGVSARGAAQIRDGVMYLSRDGVRFIGYDGKSVVISKAIASDLSPAAGDIIINYEGDILMSDPSADTMWWADPDTMRVDDMGDGRISWWKWTGQNIECLTFDNDVNGTTQLLGYDADTGRLVKNGTNGYDTALNGTTQNNIKCTLKTKYYSFREPNTKKRFVRLKLETSRSGAWTLSFISDNGLVTSADIGLDSGTGTEHYYGDITVPYEQDGYNMAIQLVNETANSVEIDGFSLQWERRVF